MWFHRKTGSKRVKAVSAIAVEGLVLASEHSLVMVFGSRHCSKWLKHLHTESPELSEWFSTNCDPSEGASVSKRVGLSRPSRLPEGASVYAGRHQLHQSHAMAVFRGLYYLQAPWLLCILWILAIVALPCSENPTQGSFRRLGAEDA